MARAKEFSLDLRKRIFNVHCKGEGYTKLSKRFQVSRTAVRGIIKKFKESSVIQNLSGRGRKAKISKTLKQNLVRDVSKNPRTTAKSLVNDLAKSGFEVSEKTVTRALHRNGLRGYRPRRTPLLPKRHLQARLKFAKNNLQKSEGYWKQVMWSDETKLEMSPMFGENKEKPIIERTLFLQ